MLLKLHLLTCLLIVDALDISSLVFVIISQPNSHHLQLAEELKKDLEKQIQDLHKGNALIHLTHSEFPHPGAWTVIPLLPKIEDLHGRNSSWVVFLEDRTRVRVEKLLKVLEAYDHEKDLFIGHGLFDQEATIIHHFAFHENPSAFIYPYFGSGFVLSTNLVNKLAKHVESQHVPASDFSIDSSHELALFIDSLTGIKLIDNEGFCISDNSNCATSVQPFKICGAAVPSDSIYFAVKTCSKFHKDRVSVVQETWGKYTERINFFSDVQDDSIPTVSLGISNVERGHCQKTLGILKHSAEKLKGLTGVKWVIIVDDDTILSVSKIRQLLSCYGKDVLVMLGERYAFNVQEIDGYGYNYITGGGGMVFSRDLVFLLATGICECPTDDTPDDMYLGLCLKKLRIPITHSPAFHQARPMDYAQDYLALKDSVSFHKHWMTDPIKIYKEWFEEYDISKPDRTEL